MRILWLLFALLIGIGAALWLMAPTGSTPLPAAPAPTAPSRPEATRTDDPVRRVDARTNMLDGRFEVVGHGSEDDPYRVRWDLLGSARETILSDGSATEAPKWIRLLDGAWIEISGYVSTPIVTDETREVLFTMNRWDGCCIGIPPTPFDSIEVRLEKPITFVGKHAIRFGIMRGQLRVEPFALGGALLGIYRLEHGIVTTQAE